MWTPKTSLTSSGASLALTYTSPNGQDGFPGTVVATVTFTLGRTNALTIHYGATTDKPTVINLTNHTYFNLGGEASGTIYNQDLSISCCSLTAMTTTGCSMAPAGAGRDSPPRRWIRQPAAC